MNKRIASGAMLAAGTVAMVGLTGLPAAAEATSVSVPAHCELGDAPAAGIDGTVALALDAPASVPAGRRDFPLTLHPALTVTDPAAAAALLTLGEAVTVSDLTVDATATRTDPAGATSTAPVRFVGDTSDDTAFTVDPDTGAVTVSGTLTPDGHGWIGSDPTGSVAFAPTALSATLGGAGTATTLRCELDQADGLAPVQFVADAEAGTEAQPPVEDEASAAPATETPAAQPSGVRELANTGAGPVVPIFITGLSLLIAGVGLLVGLRWLAPRNGSAEADPTGLV